jgi:hypothetical protein
MDFKNPTVVRHRRRFNHALWNFGGLLLAAIITALATAYSNVQRDRFAIQRDRLESRVQELEATIQELKTQKAEWQEELTAMPPKGIVPVGMELPSADGRDAGSQVSALKAGPLPLSPVSMPERRSTKATPYIIRVSGIAQEEKEGFWSQNISEAIGFQIRQGVPFFNKLFDRGPVLCSHPASPDSPALYEIATTGPVFRFLVRAHPFGDSKLEVWSGDTFLFGDVVDQRNSWREIAVDIPSGVTKIEMRHIATGWHYEFLYLYFDAAPAE